MSIKTVILLVCLASSQILCNPIGDSSENFHDKRSVGNLIMPLLSGLTGSDGGGSGGNGILGLLGSMFINQITNGGAAHNNRPINDHFGSASNANRPDLAPQHQRARPGMNLNLEPQQQRAGPGMNLNLEPQQQRAGPGINLNLDLGRLGSNLVNGYTAGKQFATAGGAMLGNFLNNMAPPHGRNIHQQNHFRNRQPESAPSFQHANADLSPPQQFQDEMPRNYHGQRTPMPPLPPPPVHPLPLPPHHQHSLQNEVPPVPPYMRNSFQPFQFQQQNPQEQTPRFLVQPEKQRLNHEQHQLENEQQPPFDHEQLRQQPKEDEQISTTSNPSNSDKQKSKGKNKANKNSDNGRDVNNAASAANHGNEAKQDPTLTHDFSQPSPAASSLFSSHHVNFQPQQQNRFSQANDNFAFATDHFNLNTNPKIGFFENSLGPTQQSRVNYAHSVPATFDHNDHQENTNEGDTWPVGDETFNVEEPTML